MESKKYTSSSIGLDLDSALNDLERLENEGTCFETNL
jgi:hypothetical protein